MQNNLSITEINVNNLDISLNNNISYLELPKSIVGACEVYGFVETYIDIPEEKECVFCFDFIEDDKNSNNAEPVKNGICCNKCNADIVIPARINLYYKKKLEDSFIAELEMNISEMDICKEFNLPSPIEYIDEENNIKYLED